jgi:hypothetical protein
MKQAGPCNTTSNSLIDCRMQQAGPCNTTSNSLIDCRMKQAGPCNTTSNSLIDCCLTWSEQYSLNRTSLQTFIHVEVKSHSANLDDSAGFCVLIGEISKKVIRPSSDDSTAFYMLIGEISKMSFGQPRTIPLLSVCWVAKYRGKSNSANLRWLHYFPSDKRQNTRKMLQIILLIIVTPSMV